MADDSGSGGSIYLIVGGLSIAIIVLALLMFGGTQNEPDIAVETGDTQTEVETNTQ